MAKPPNKRDPAKHSSKDPARPTRAKASRPELAPTQPGLQPPPDNSFDRRADFSAAHRARKSTAQGFNEAPQADYAAKSPASFGELDPDLAKALGIDDDNEGAGDAPLPPPPHPHARPAARPPANV